MKRTLHSFVNRPKLIAGLSLILALSIASYVVWGDAWRAHPVFAEAGPQSIAVSGETPLAGTESVLALAFSVGGNIRSVNATVGQTVHKGDVLAELEPLTTEGGLTQAQAAYEAASANYTEVDGIAAGHAVEVARATRNAADVSLKETILQQDTLVANAKRTLNTADLVAVPASASYTVAPPLITGIYTGEQEGTYNAEVERNVNQNRVQIQTFGIESTGDLLVSKTAPTPLGTKGLFISFPTDPIAYADTEWNIQIPNTASASYRQNYNAYIAAVQARTQAVASARAALATAQANFDAAVTAAQAQKGAALGTLQIAEAAYEQRRLRAPEDGVITAVRITAGQAAAPNVPALELSSSLSVKSVAVAVPNAAIIERDGAFFVRVKTEGGIAERAITRGMQDNSYTEILSGLSPGEQVAVLP